jgi:hypothetical protein
MGFEVHVTIDSVKVEMVKLSTGQRTKEKHRGKIKKKTNTNCNVSSNQRP